HARMPAFGFSDDDAAAVAAYLASVSQPVELAKLPAAAKPNPRRPARSGETLFHSLGCLACHTAGDLGRTPDFGGGDLSDVGNRRSAEWLDSWLSTPVRLNADHRRPVFQASNGDRRARAAYLAGLKGDGKPQATSHVRQRDGETLARGKALVAAARCAACH